MIPTRFSWDWPDVATSAAWRAAGAAPDFVVVDNWRVGGRAGVALGPRVPICAFTGDPRGFAFSCDPRRWLGKDALIVVPKESAASALPAFAYYFRSVDPAAGFAIGRGGSAERVLEIARAHDLIRAYPLPYGPSR